MVPPFKLTASLAGHDDDVRSVIFPSPSLAISASRDATVRLWKLQKDSRTKFEADISSHGSSFVNAVTFVQQSTDYPEGLVISGGKEGILDVRSTTSSADKEADAFLPAHEGNICTLDVSPDGTIFVSGSWDCSAAIWRTGKWEEPLARLDGHEASVWAVLAYDDKIVITGSADKYIRLFDISGKLIKRFQASDDVVRALVRLPADHSSGAQFASAGNDSRIRLWTLEGIFMGELFGHENFIYSLGVLPSGEIVSSSEDRTVRIWSGTQCIQSITHPAISVWSVAVCQETGDIVTGSSDKIVRIFSRSPERQADADQLRAFEESVQASSIPQQSLGEINKTDLPGPDFIQNKSGTKEGQVQLIKETNGNVTAYQWTTQGNTWVSVGTVVDAAGSATKVTYNGQDYDYVFDVDIEDGKPALKLPYNVSQSPFEVARKFIETNKLPMTYVDSVVDFITKNTQGQALGPQSGGTGSAPTGADPWGTESRYRPDTGSQQPSQSSQTTTAANILPQKTYLAISTGSHKMILKKIEEYNEAFVAEGRKDLALQPSDIAVLADTMAKLEPVAGKQEASISVPAGATNASLRAITEWPVDKRLPWLDMLRLLVAASPDAITQISAEPPQTLVERLTAAGAFDKSISPDNNVMLAVRTLANLFCSQPGRTLADSGFDAILDLVTPFSESPNKNLCIALTTLYINFAVLLTGGSAVNKKTSESETTGREKQSDANRALALLSALTHILNGTSDAEALYRALVAVGSVLYLGSDFVEVAKEGMEIEAAVDRAESVAGKEARVAKLIKEIRTLFAA